MSSIGDKCGVFGIFGVERASELAYLGLHYLQHRGQESCGIVSFSKRKYYSHYGMGLVNEVFSPEILKKLKGDNAIGHCRYSTQGSSSLENSQPIFGEIDSGEIAIAHNGEIFNSALLRKSLKKNGCIFKGNSDTEVVLHLLANSKKKSLKDKILDVFRLLKPSFSILIMSKDELFAIRDNRGIRPLVIGKFKTGYVAASETVALDILGADIIREVNPGECVLINKNGISSFSIGEKKRPLKCIFEYIYFARPDSFLFGNSVTVSEVRKEFGKALYYEHKVDADVVIPVPDSSIYAALGFSIASKIPFDFGLVRSHYVGRTFIEPTQVLRDIKVRRKFNTNKSVINGKRVVVVEDSIVRGTTLKKVVSMLKESGAKEVHVRVSAPPYRYSCYLGIDTADTKSLIAHDREVEEVRKFIEADSLGYLSEEAMLSNSYIDSDFCTYCFDGKRKIN
jgi:amidophosphoribosyltransferase